MKFYDLMGSCCQNCYPMDEDEIGEWIKYDDVDNILLLGYLYKLRVTASKVGPMHTYWDIISDLECFIDGKKGAVLEMNSRQWVNYLGDLFYEECKPFKVRG